MRQSGEPKTKKLERCVSLLKKVIQDILWVNIVIAYHYCYNFCYLIGAYTIRYNRIAVKKVVRSLKPVGRFLCKAADFILLRHLRSLARNITAEIHRFFGGFPIAVNLLRSASAQGPVSCLKTALRIPCMAVKRHKRALCTLGNLVAPAAAVAVLVLTVQFWSGMTFALAVEYDGEPLGYISDESVYDVAANMATDRVINTDNSFEVQRVPKLTIAVVSKSEIMDESAVCDKILETSGDSITEGSGLYIDGKFEGAVQSREELESLLDSLLKSYCEGGSNERAEFVQNVEIVDGLYPISSVISIDETYSRLTEQTIVDKYYTIVKGDSPLLISAKTDMSLAELRALNPDFDKKIFPDVKVLIQKAQPYLRVQVVRTTEYKETIPFNTKQVKDQKQYIGYSSVKTKGVAGEQLIKAEITYIDGIEQSRKILETKVVKQPVDKVVVVGAKKINNSVSAAGDGISTGRFVWPLPSCRRISSPFGKRWGRLHAGIDISGNGVYGKPVVSADGGVVAEVNHGWGGGYGKYIIIDHGGGYRTVYAHLSAINVRAGQKVSQGQLIGRAGNSGQSYGAHLHFEIRINGRSVNPVPYLR
jgi:murein DD-endopeptidase MepM/ murein hydrolase activator NlpD